jgi:hypothetical protein
LAAAPRRAVKSWCGERGVLGREFRCEHRQPALGLFPGGFVLNDIPVFGEPAVFDADDVGCYPVGGLPDIGESPCSYT